jgi:molecular chaperone GrpE
MEELLDPQPESGGAAGEAAAALEPAQALEAVTADRNRLQAEKDELWDRFLRKQAEFENFRRRTTREKEEIREFAAMETVRLLLPVVDDFERALKVPAAGDEYRKGIELIHKRLYDTLVQLGLTPIDTAGKKFDPNYHQAVDTVRTEEQEDHAIVEEFQRGYEFKGRLLRPAMVKVAVRE